MQINVFTNVNLILLSLGYMMGIESTLWKLSCCNAFGSTISFSCTPLFDSFAYEKQRKKNNFTFLVFYLGHITLHVIPCIFILYNLPENIEIHTCIIAFGIKVLWAFLTCGSIYLNDVYVPMEKNVWESTWFISFLSHFFPLFLIYIKR